MQQLITDVKKKPRLKAFIWLGTSNRISEMMEPDLYPHIPETLTLSKFYDFYRKNILSYEQLAISRLMSNIIPSGEKVTALKITDQ